MVRCDDAGELFDDGELFVSVERASVGEDLDPHIGTITVHVGQTVGG